MDRRIQKNLIVLAAGLLAQKLHAGQKDKGGNDYFRAHLLRVGMCGQGWKEKVVGFLHDATEDTPVTTPELMRMLADKTRELGNTPKELWWQDWMDAAAPGPEETTQPLTDEEITEISETLNLLNHNTAPTREEYINRMRNHPLAIRVKLNDLANNLDISRIPHPTDKDLARAQRYMQERRKLQKMLDELPC